MIPMRCAVLCGGWVHDPRPEQHAGLARGWRDGHALWFYTLAAQAEASLSEDPYSGHLFVFRGRHGDFLKIIWWDQQGACLFSKRLERGRFVWPVVKDGKVSMSPAQLSMLLEGIDWRMPQRTWRPLTVG